MQYVKEDPSAPGSPIRDGDMQNVDQLIPKLNFFFYGCRNHIDNIEKQGGIYTPQMLLEKFPNQADEIKKVYSHVWDCKIKRNSVMAFLSRVPITLPNTKAYNEGNLPVRISVTKLLKSNSKYKAFLFNHPKDPKKLHELNIDQIDKLTKMEDRWYHEFRKSKDPYFRDVPQVAIYCSESGQVPSFACKILRGE
jgi:hypothetical protein